MLAKKKKELCKLLEGRTDEPTHGCEADHKLLYVGGRLLREDVRNNTYYSVSDSIGPLEHLSLQIDGLVRLTVRMAV